METGKKSTQYHIIMMCIYIRVAVLTTPSTTVAQSIIIYKIHLAGRRSTDQNIRCSRTRVCADNTVPNYPHNRIYIYIFTHTHTHTHNMPFIMAGCKIQNLCVHCASSCRCRRRAGKVRVCTNRTRRCMRINIYAAQGTPIIIYTDI